VLQDTMSESLANLRVTVNFSDPWDLGESLGWLGRDGIIVDVNVRTNKFYGNREELALIKLGCPFAYRDATCEYFIASPRYEKDSLSSLVSLQSVDCGMTLISEETSKVH
jgi:hypothetical protein